MPCIVILVEDVPVELKRPPEAADILHGTLDLLIPGMLVMKPERGHTHARSIESNGGGSYE